VALMRAAVEATHGPRVLGGLGGFAGLWRLAGDRESSGAAGPAGLPADPVLAAASDGVGTKLLVAQALDRHDTVGVDLVAMVVDDVVVTGAEPLFVLDYLAVGRVDPERVAAIVAGVAEGCRQARCALLGGETAEHPDAMAPDAYDLAGFALGVVERDRLLGPDRVTAGDVLGNLPRCLPPGLTARVDRGSWDPPPIFQVLADLGPVDDHELARATNLGVGMVAALPAAEADHAAAFLAERDIPSWVMGEVVRGG
jgi:phosphoribosylaminoimidazole (AIR) synthetase